MKKLILFFASALVFAALGCSHAEKSAAGHDHASCSRCNHGDDEHASAHDKHRTVAANASSANLDELRAKQTKLAQDLQKLNQDTSCASDKDCVALEVGSKACGGPAGFAIVSKKNKSFKTLEGLALQITKLDRQINEASQGFSTCSVVMPPKLKCADKKCK